MKSLAHKMRIGPMEFKNRIVMSAMTRRRTDPKTGIPNNLMVQYYTQRAGAGLIITECSAVSPRGDGFPGSGNIFNQQQAEGWQNVVQSVHNSGGRIFLQLYHGGRNLHSSFIGGQKPLAPSAVAIRNKVPGYPELSFQIPKEMTMVEIQILKQEFINSFKLAKFAGFDGIEIHGANGYILDSFLRSSSNKRADKYGGSQENRARLTLEVVEEATKIWDKERIGIKLSPVGRYGDMYDDNPLKTYSYLLKKLDDKKIGFVELVSSQNEQPLYGYTPPSAQMHDVLHCLRPCFKGTIIANQGFNKESAEEIVKKGDADMVSFAKLYISNPDLAQRIMYDNPLDPRVDPTTFYQGGSRGYTDYPTYHALRCEL